MSALKNNTEIFRVALKGSHRVGGRVVFKVVINLRGKAGKVKIKFVRSDSDDEDVGSLFGVIWFFSTTMAAAAS